MNYQKWLTATAQHYGVTEESILKPRGTSMARKTFYYLCWKDGMNLYKLSEALGLKRTTVISNLYYSDARDKEAEKEIRMCVEARTLENVIDYWLTRQDCRAKEIILTSLLAQKQYLYEET